MRHTATPSGPAAALIGALQSRGFEAGDFELEEAASSELSDLLGARGGILRVRCWSTGEERSYTTGTGSAWFGAFLMDLGHGYFSHAARARAPSTRRRRHRCHASSTPEREAPSDASADQGRTRAPDLGGSSVPRGSSNSNTVPSGDRDRPTTEPPWARTNRSSDPSPSPSPETSRPATLGAGHRDAPALPA